MKLIIAIFPFTLLLASCFNDSEIKIISIEKDKFGRVVKEISEGFEYREGSFYRTKFFDTLGREIKILQVRDYHKTVQIFEYSDSSTYEYKYYDLGDTKDYADSNFSITAKDISHTRHIRLNNNGDEVYEFTKWFGDSVYCQESFYDSLTKGMVYRDISCK